MRNRPEKAKILDILYLRKVLKKSQIFSACFKSNSTWLAFKYLGPEQCNTFSANQLLYYFGCSSRVTHADFQYKSKEEQKLIRCKTLNQKFDILDIFEFINPSSKEYVDPSTHWRSAQQDFQRATGFSASRQRIILSSDLTLNQTKRHCFRCFEMCER